MREIERFFALGQVALSAEHTVGLQIGNRSAKYLKKYINYTAHAT